MALPRKKLNWETFNIFMYNHKTKVQPHKKQELSAMSTEKSGVGQESEEQTKAEWVLERLDKRAHKNCVMFYAKKTL